MEVLLYRWSTMAQLVSDTMIMIFLIVLYRSVRRPELQPHVWAWSANFAALSITVGYWVFRPEQEWLSKLLGVLYVSLKMSFACMLIVGVAALSGRAVRGPTVRWMLLASAGYGLWVGLTYRSINELGVYNAVCVALLLWSAVVLILREKPPAMAWLAAGFAVRALFASVEAFAYISQLTGIVVLPPELLTSYLASHSAFDGAAEWMIVLGCVLTMYRIIAAELAHSHQEMSAAKERMRALAESDMLPGWPTAAP